MRPSWVPAKKLTGVGFCQHSTRAVCQMQSLLSLLSLLSLSSLFSLLSLSFARMLV